MKKNFETIFGNKAIEMTSWNGELVPKTIYKYRDWKNEYHKKIIINQDLFIPSPKNFNDPYDCKLPVSFHLLKNNKELARKYFENTIREFHPSISQIKLTKKVEEKLKHKDYEDVKFIEKINNDLIKWTQENLGIFSATAVNDNILMWAHYANNHTGICIGFDLIKLQETFNLSFGNINYVENFPEWNEALKFEWRWKQISRQIQKSKPSQKPIERRLEALETLMALDKPTSKAQLYSSWEIPPKIVYI